MPALRKDLLSPAHQLRTLEAHPESPRNRLARRRISLAGRVPFPHLATLLTLRLRAPHLDGGRHLVLPGKKRGRRLKTNGGPKDLLIGMFTGTTRSRSQRRTL